MVPPGEKDGVSRLKAPSAEVLRLEQTGLFSLARMITTCTPFLSLEKVLWKFSTGGKVFSSVAIGKDGAVYFGSADNFLYGIYSNGTKRFSFKTGGTVYGGPALSPDQTLYFGSLDNYTYALFSNGTIKWKFKSGAVYGQP